MVNKHNFYFNGMQIDSRVCAAIVLFTMQCCMGRFSIRDVVSLHLKFSLVNIFYENAEKILSRVSRVLMRERYVIPNHCNV